MIDSIQITNFQSHNDTQIDFHPGINVITGKSDSGKSSVIRALLWCIENSPTGEGFVSNFIRGKTGKQEGVTAVTVTKDGKTVTRERSRQKIDGKFAEFNGYRSNFTDDFKALRGAVPATVDEFFHLSPTNISRQFDQPFLLSQTGGEISRYLNQIIRMDEMDTVIANLEKHRRQQNKTLSENQEILKRSMDELEKLSWLEQSLQDMRQMDDLIAANNKNKEASAVLYSLISDSKLAENEIKNLDFVNNLTRNMKNIQISIEKLDKTRTIYQNLTELVDEYRHIRMGNKVALWEAVELSKYDNSSYVALRSEYDCLSTLVDNIASVKVGNIEDVIILTESLQKRHKSLQSASDQTEALQGILEDLKRSGDDWGRYTLELAVVKDELNQYREYICPKSGSFCQYMGGER